MSSETTPTATPVSITSHKRRGRAGPVLTSVDGAFELIELGLIDEPALAIRETMDEVQLAELCDSIAAVGVLEPLVVERAGDRYRVMAGHRRLIACQALKLPRVPCIVRDAGVIDATAVTIAENHYRENVNPAEEAVFLDRLLNERCNGDTNLLAALVKHKREYVEDRLLLLRGDAAVLGALKGRKITLAVARELQKVKIDDQRTVYLDAAIRGGATAAIVRNWRQQGELVSSAETQPATAPDATASVPAAAPAYKMVCFFCGDDDCPHLMEMLWVHQQCRKFLERSLAMQTAPAPEGKG